MRSSLEKLVKTSLKKLKSSNSGDTLIEVLISITIVLLLVVSVLSVHVYYKRTSNKINELLHLESMMEDMKFYYDKYGTTVYVDDEINEDKLAFADYFFDEKYNRTENEFSFVAYLDNDYKAVEDNGKYQIDFWLEEDKLNTRVINIEDNDILIDTICFGYSKNSNKCIYAFNSISGFLQEQYYKLSTIEFYELLQEYIYDDMFIYLNEDYLPIEKKNDILDSLYRIRYDNDSNGCFIINFYYREVDNEEFKYYKSVNYGINIDNLINLYTEKYSGYTNILNNGLTSIVKKYDLYGGIVAEEQESYAYKKEFKLDNEDMIITIYNVDEEYRSYSYNNYLDFYNKYIEFVAASDEYYNDDIEYGKINGQHYIVDVENNLFYLEYADIDFRNNKLVNIMGNDYIDSGKSFEEWINDCIKEEYEEDKVNYNVWFSKNLQLNESEIYYITISYSKTEETNKYKLVISSQYKVDNSFSSPATFEYCEEIEEEQQEIDDDNDEGEDQTEGNGGEDAEG